MENGRKGDHYLITFSNYTHFSIILSHDSHCECAISPRGRRKKKRAHEGENRHLSRTYRHRGRRMIRTHEIRARTDILI